MITLGKSGIAALAALGLIGASAAASAQTQVAPANPQTESPSDFESGWGDGGANRSYDDYGEPAAPGAYTAPEVTGSIPQAGAEETGGNTARCAQRYRSFNPSTGYYTTYSGEQRLCPYLR
jgi:hypothetical protein